MPSSPARPLLALLALAAALRGGAQTPGSGALLPEPTAPPVLSAPAPAASASGPGALAAPAPADGSEGAAPAAPSSSPPADLVTTTMALDISTASFYELVDWLRGLGLPETGSAEELRRRLYEHYGLTPPPAPSASGRVVTIESAEEATYSGGTADSSIVSLEGGVRLSIKEVTGEAYTISARRIVYDRGRNSVYATGSVVYTRSSQGKTEEFRGSTLAADLGDWSGLFLDGVWRQQGTSLGSGDRGLVFSSATLRRSSGDFVVLDDAVVSPGQSDTPNFSIRASRLWFLGESDWAALSALVYVGEVPLLWLPFFYNPSEEIFFHPVFGFRSREGSFLQTSTWLLGQKPPAAASSSIIQFAPTTGPTELRGIFLKHVPGSAASAPSAAPADSSAPAGSPTAAASDSLRLLADWYVGLGAFSGLDASLAPGGALTKFELSSGLGFSRSLFPGYGIYSPYGSASDYQSVWNGSEFFGARLPFRWGGQLSLGLSFAGLRSSLDLPLYSDSYFEQDFRNRSYDMDWLGLSKTGSDATTISSRSSLTQKLALSGSVPVGSLSPWLQTLGLTLTSSLSWLSKQDSLLLNRLTAAGDAELFSYDPARQFFYPDDFRPVDLSLNLGGSLLSLPAPASSPTVADSGTGVSVELRSPWEGGAAGARSTGAGAPASPAGSKPGGALDEAGDEAAAAAPDEAGARTAGPLFPAPELAPDLPAPAPVAPLSAKLSWSLQPGLVLERRFLTDPWKGRADIDYASLWDLASWKATAGLNSSLAFRGSALSASYNLSWTQQDQVRRSTGDSSASGAIQAISLSDAQYPRRRLTGSLRLASQPLPPASVFASSSLSWNLDSTLYSWSFDHFGVAADPSSAVFVERFPSWTSQAVTANSLGLNLVAKTGPTQQLLSLSASLPPLTESYAATLALAAAAGDWNLSLGGQERAVRQLGGELKPGPLTASLKLGAPLGLSLSDSLTWDYGLEGPSANAATAAWGFATANLQSQYAQRLKPQSGVGWVADGSYAFIPSSFAVSLAPRLDPSKDALLQPSLSSSFSYTQSLLRFSDSIMLFSLNFSLKLGAGFSLSLSSQSQNRNAWRYWPGIFSIPAELGSPEQFRVDPLKDLLNAFAVWDPEALQAANFKLKSLSAKLDQDLDDWTLSASISAAPTLHSASGAGDNSYWYIDPTFNLSIAWKDVPAIKSAITYQNSSLSW